MTDEQKYKVKKIIYWKNKIIDIDNFLITTNTARRDKTLFTKSYKVKFFGFFIKAFERSIELDSEMFLMFYQWLGEYKNHLQGLVDNSDAELVSIADVIRTGEITREGLDPLE